MYILTIIFALTITLQHVFFHVQELNQVVEKNKKDLVNDDGIPPKVYIRCVSELEDVVNEAWKGKKNLKKLAAKGLTSLRSSMKKHNKEKVRTITRTSLSHAATHHRHNQALAYISFSRCLVVFTTIRSRHNQAHHLFILLIIS